MGVVIRSNSCSISCVSRARVTRFGSITDNLTRILLRKPGLEGAVNVRQMGGTIEVAAAFQNRLIAGAVTSELRVTPPSQPKILVRLVDMGIPYSMSCTGRQNATRP